MSYKKFAFLTLILWIMSGCSSILSADNGSENTYVLSSIQQKAPHKPYAGLIVAKPLLSSGLNNERIALMRDDIRLDYFAGAKWSDNLGLMVQDRMVESLQNSDGYKFVIDDKVNLEAPSILVMDVQKFYIDFGTANSNGDYTNMNAEVAIAVKLIATNTRSIKQQFVVRASQAIAKDNMKAHADALNVAFNETQKQIIQKLR